MDEERTIDETKPFQIDAHGDINNVIDTFDKTPNRPVAELSVSPLQLACERGDLEAVKILGDALEAINLPNRLGKTPLHIASQHGYL